MLNRFIFIFKFDLRVRRGVALNASLFINIRNFVHTFPLIFNELIQSANIKASRVSYNIKFITKSLLLCIRLLEENSSTRKTII